MRIICAIAAGAVAFAAGAGWVRLNSPAVVPLRGLHAVNAKIAWASGAKGTVLRTLDGGATWAVRAVPGGGELDFRDVHAFDADNAVAISSGPADQSRIYHTSDGGRHWTLAFQNRDETGFFDCMDFWDRRRGLLVGDPVNGRFVLLRTGDGGATWTPASSEGMPQAGEAEGAFAAGGTCLAVAEGGRAWFGTGGTGGGRVFRSSDWGRTWTVVDTPLRHGNASSGIFSIAFARGGRRGIVVGGDYRNPTDGTSNVAITADGGSTWSPIAGPGPAGFRSAVAWTRGGVLLATGTSGTDLSRDGGHSWTSVGTDPFNAVSPGAPLTAWFAGPGGALARFTAPPR